VLGAARPRRCSDSRARMLRRSSLVAEGCTLDPGWQGTCSPKNGRTVYGRLAILHRTRVPAPARAGFQNQIRARRFFIYESARPVDAIRPVTSSLEGSSLAEGESVGPS